MISLFAENSESNNPGAEGKKVYMYMYIFE